MRRTRRIGFVVAVIGLMAVPQVSRAQNASRSEREARDANQQQVRAQDQREGARSQRRAEGRRGAEGDVISGEGEILRLKKVGIRGRKVEHLVVLVRTPEDNRGVVDLGPVKELKELKLRRGDRIQFRGTPMQVGDRGVLMAQRVRKGQRTVRPERADQPQQVTRRAVRRSDLGQPRSQRRTAQLRGTVERTKEVGVRDRDADHLVALLRTDRDRLRVVDLGPVDNLEAVRLARGDTIAVAGDVALVGDRLVLMARQLRKDGEDYRIAGRQPRSQPRQQPSRQQRQRERQSRQTQQ